MGISLSNFQVKNSKQLSTKREDLILFERKQNAQTSAFHAKEEIQIPEIESLDLLYKKKLSKSYETINSDSSVGVVEENRSIDQKSKKNDFEDSTETNNLMQNEDEEIDNSKCGTPISTILDPVEVESEKHTGSTSGEEGKDSNHVSGAVFDTFTPSKLDIENNTATIQTEDTNLQSQEWNNFPEPLIPKFPDPVKIDVSYAADLPRLNTVANFSEKKIIPCKDTFEHTCLYDMDNGNQNNKKSTSFESEKDINRNDSHINVWSNFRDKKVVSYIPRPKVQDIYSDKNKTPSKGTPKSNIDRTISSNDLIKEMKKMKREEMKSCNTNLELLSNLISVHPMVRSRHDSIIRSRQDTRASSLRSYTNQQKFRYRRELEAMSRYAAAQPKLHPREWQ